MTDSFGDVDEIGSVERSKVIGWVQKKIKCDSRQAKEEDFLISILNDFFLSFKTANEKPE